MTGDAEPRPASALIARDGRRLLGSVSLAVSGQAAAFAAGFFCMVLTTRLLGPEGYGRLALFFMILEILSQLVGWPNLGLVRFGREEMGESGRLPETFWARSALFGGSLVVAAALLFLFRRPLAAYLELEYAPAVLLMLFLALNEGVFLLRGVFQTLSAFRAYALISFGVRALNLLFIILAFIILAMPASVAGIIGAQIASIVVVAVAAAVLLPWRLLLPARLRAGAVRRVSSYSWPLILGGMSAFVVNWVDLVVIKAFCAKEALGCYAVAYQAVTVLTALQVAVVSAVLPLLVSLAVERRRDELVWYLDEALPQLAWAIGLGSLLLAAGAELIPFVLGKAYGPAIVPCQVLMAGVAFSAFGAFQATLAKAMDRVGATLLVMVVLAALNVVLDLVLVPRIGILGAAVATSISFALSGLLYFPILNAISDVRSPGAGKRYAALYGLLPPIAFGVLSMLLGRPAFRLGAALGIALLAVLAARVSGVFRIGTLEKVRRMHMPSWVMASVRRFYILMGS